MKEAGLEEVEEYVLRRHNKTAKYIEMQPILYLCKELI